MIRLTPYPLSPDEEAVLSNGDPGIIRDKLQEIDSGQYIAVARVGIGCSVDSHLDRLRAVGVDVGVDNNIYGFLEVGVDGNKSRELRIFRN